MFGTKQSRIPKQCSKGLGTEAWCRRFARFIIQYDQCLTGIANIAPDVCPEFGTDGSSDICADIWTWRYGQQVLACE